MSDLATITMLSDLADHDMVIDITIMSSGGFTVNLSCMDKDSISGMGSTLFEATENAYKLLEEKMLDMRNLL